jgi:hypothetical protein
MMNIRLLLLFLIGLSSVQAAPLYLVTIDSSTINPLAAVLEFQYSTLNTLSSTASITDFTGATLGSVIPPTVAATGDLATNNLVLTATNPISDYALNINVNANAMAFILALDGPAINTPNGSPDGTTFSIFLFTDNTFTTGLLTPDGLVGQINIDGNGVIVTDGFGVTTFSDVPEPATLYTLAGGIALLVFTRRRRG